MGKSKIVFGSETLVDLTADTVTAEKLVQGATAHGANGETVTGMLPSGNSFLGTGNAPTKPTMNRPYYNRGAQGVFAQTTALKDFYVRQGDTLHSESFPVEEIGEALPEQVLKGVTFSSINGMGRTGTLVVHTYRTGYGAPDNSLGADGDLYFDMG